jgi:hypothetical protein
MLDEIRHLIEQYLAGEIAMADFSVRFAALYARTRQDRHSSRGAAELCSAAIGPFAEYSRGHRSEASLKAGLAKAIRPFASQAEEPARPYAVTKPQKITLDFSPIRKPVENAPMAVALRGELLYCG